MRRNRPLAGAAEGRIVRARWWSITINCKEDQRTPDKPYLCLEDNGLLYYCFQLEQCPTTDRLHFQGCLRYDRPVSMRQVKEFVRVPHAHLEAAKDYRSLIVYCKKEESRVEGPWEGGCSGDQGKRSDLAEVAEILRSGGTIQDVADVRPEAIIRYGRGILTLQETLQRSRLRPHLKVYLVWGPTGTGKTWLAHQLDRNVQGVADLKNPWFNGYTGGKTLLLDEAGKGMMCVNLLKRILDVYPVAAPVKGGFVPINCDTIIITSNTYFADWYPGLDPMDLAAVARRFTKIYHIESQEQSSAALREIQGNMPVLGAVRPDSPAPFLYHPTEEELAMEAGLMAAAPAGRPRPSHPAVGSVLSEPANICDVLSDSEDDVGPEPYYEELCSEPDDTV